MKDRDKSKGKMYNPNKRHSNTLPRNSKRQQVQETNKTFDSSKRGDTKHRNQSKNRSYHHKQKTPMKI